MVARSTSPDCGNLPFSRRLATIAVSKDSQPLPVQQGAFGLSGANTPANIR